MKTKHSIIGGLFACMAMLTSCGSDYLNTDPTSSTSPEAVFLTTENAYAAINGIHKAMYRQYNRQSCSGEGSIKIFSEKLGDALSSFGSNGWFNAVMNWNQTVSDSDELSYHPWIYYYTLISNANLIIENIEEATGPEKDKQIISGQAYAYRAYSHYMIAQFYGPRYNSANLSTLVAPLMDQTYTEGQPKSSLGDIMNKCREDINEAIRLLNEAGYTNDHKSNIRLNAAYGISARIALFMGDYGTAASHAALARNGYPLMSNNTYQYEGFNNINNEEWIWGSEVQQVQTLYFWAYHAFMAYNSSSSYIKGSPQTISKPLFRQIPETDLRKQMFVNPGVGNERIEAVPNDSTSYYRNKHDIPSANAVWYYGNLKFKTTYDPGGGDFCHMRSAEMYLIEAEAKAKGGDEGGARQALYEVVSPRDPAYTLSTNSGDALLEEIYFYRKIELWGEGFNWFDLKRNNKPLLRQDEANGGNYRAAYTFNVQPEDARWIIEVPRQEKNSNQNLSK